MYGTSNIIYTYKFYMHRPTHRVGSFQLSSTNVIIIPTYVHLMCCNIKIVGLVNSIESLKYIIFVDGYHPPSHEAYSAE